MDSRSLYIKTNVYVLVVDIVSDPTVSLQKKKKVGSGEAQPPIRWPSSASARQLGFRAGCSYSRKLGLCLGYQMGWLSKPSPSCQPWDEESRASERGKVTRDFT
jgi:hypothetical protein